MMKVKKLLRNTAFGICSLLLAAGTVACSSEPQNNAQSGQQTASTDQAATTGNEPKTGGVLRLANPKDVTSFDPIIAVDNVSIWIITNMYDQLVRLSADGKTIEPGLATDWKLSDDGKTYTFNLRKDVQFNNGMPVTAEDVKFSLDRARGQDSNASSFFTSVQSIDITGGSQVTIKLNTPYVPLLSILAMYSSAIVPEKVVKEKGKEFGNNPVGSGPFMLDSWQRGQKVTLKKNPNYWQKGKPYLDGVEYSQVAEDTTKVLKLHAKEIDITSEVPFNLLDQLKADSSLNVMVSPFARLDMIGINNTKEPFTDVKIRQAMNYVVNKEDIIKAVLNGNGEPASSYLPKVMYLNEQLEGYKYNLEKAKELMAQSSKPKGFKTSLMIKNGNEISKQVAVIVKEQLKAIGIDVEIQQMEPGAAYEAQESMNYEMIMGYYSSDVIDPDELTMFGVVSNGGAHSYYTGYKNPKVDELAVKAQGEQDENKRKEMYYDIQKIVSEDAPIVFLYFTPSTYVTQKEVQNFQVTPLGSYRLEDVWLKQ